MLEYLADLPARPIPVRAVMLDFEGAAAALRGGDCLAAGAGDFIGALRARGAAVSAGGGDAAEWLAAQGCAAEAACVIGDGAEAVRAARALGMRCVGLAVDATGRQGVDPAARARLVAAGADVIAGDLRPLDALLDFLGLEPPDAARRLRRRRALPTDGVATFSAEARRNLVRIDTLDVPGQTPVPAWDAPGFGEFVDRVRAAHAGGRQLILSMGAHVIKCGLSRYLIDLMRRGYITHLAGNGACSIHDFELACLGGTSEHVPTAIEDGSFGMWEQTGRWMNEAIRQGAAEGLGYGESLGRYIDRHPERFPYREDCVLYNAYRLDVPATCHIALGTDIIHQHPACDFAAIGRASGVDFHRICWSVAHLHRGVYMNFGSGVIGPEVFLKALSISRNLGYPTFDITTANFDLIDLGDFRRDLGYADPQYYYRPRKNIVNRPVSRGGMGWHFCGDHRETLPNLWRRLSEN